MSRDEILAWSYQTLEKLGYPHLEQAVEYAASLSTPDETRAYLISLFGTSDPKINAFLQDFTTKLQKFTSTSIDNPSGNSSRADPTADDLFYTTTNKKNVQANRSIEISGVLGIDGSGTRGKEKGKEHISTGNNPKSKGKSVQLFGRNASLVNDQISDKKSKQGTKNSTIAGSNALAWVQNIRNSTKYVNCLFCGKIEMELRDDALCSFCGKILMEGPSRRRLADLEPSSVSEGEMTAQESHDDSVQAKNELVMAEKRKNRLLNFDATSAKRTAVFDDQSDYFYSGGGEDRWQSKEEQDQQEKQRREREYYRSHRSAHKLTFTLDFGTKELTENVDKTTIQHEPPPGGVFDDEENDLDRDFDDHRVDLDVQHGSQRDSQHGSQHGSGMFRNPYLAGPAPRFLAEEAFGKK